MDVRSVVSCARQARRLRVRAARFSAAVLSVLGLVLATGPARADLGSTSDANMAASEGELVNTHGANGRGDDDPQDQGANDDYDGCVQYTSSGLTLAFTVGSVTVSNGTTSRTYDATPTAPVEAEILGFTLNNRFEGPRGTYDPNDPSQVTTTCVRQYAGSTALDFNTAPAAQGLVRFVGARDAQGDRLNCAGGGSDSYKRLEYEITVKLTNVSCTVSDVSGGNAVTQQLASSASPATVSAHIRPLGGGLLTACNSPIAPSTCELDWASTDLG